MGVPHVDSMDALRGELLSDALRQSPQAKLTDGDGGVALASTKGRCGTGEQDRS